MGCDCIDRVGKMLAERKTRFVLPIMLSDDPTPRLMIRTEKMESKRRTQHVAMFATYCPLCGIRYTGDPK